MKQITLQVQYKNAFHLYDNYIDEDLIRFNKKTLQIKNIREVKQHLAERDGCKTSDIKYLAIKQ